LRHARARAAAPLERAPDPPLLPARPARSDRVTDWNRLVRPSLLGLEPYRPGPGPREYRAAYGVEEIEKLNWNESLFPPYPGALEAAAAELTSSWMYPAEPYADFREAVAAWLGVRPEAIVPAHGVQALVATV